MYSRDDLKQIGGAYVQFLGFAPTDPDKPVRFLKSYSDEELLSVLVDAMSKSQAAGWIGKDGEERDPADMPDDLLAFAYENGVIQLPDEGAEEEEEPITDTALEEDEDLPGDADNDPDVESPPDESGDGIEDDDIAALEAEIAAAEADLSRDAPSVPEPEFTVDDELPGMAAADVDPKVNALSSEHGDSDPAAVFAQYAPVTIQNVEAAVLAIAKLLQQGKVVVISAHEIGGVPVVGHGAATVNLPATAQAQKMPTLAEYVAECVAKETAAIQRRLTSELKSAEARRAYATKHNVPLPANTRATSIEDASSRTLSKAILDHVERTVTAAATEQYNQSRTV